jgi:hypothetical protein
MRFTLLLAAVAAVTTVPAFASDAKPVRPGQTLHDAANARVGVVDQVNSDGSVRIIFNSHFVTIPADKVSNTNGVAVTSLARDDLAKIR